MSTDFQQRLDDCIARHQIPGASLAIYQEGQLTSLAAGVLNRNTGQTVAVNSPFQIGSITKVFTATLLMQLVDEGRADLDVPITQYLTDFRTGTPGATDKITLRQMLSHTSGLDGDLMVQAGTGENALSRYADMCRLLPNLFEPGTRHSYSNSAYTLLGHIIEVISGKRWDRLLMEKIAAPLKLDRVAAHAEEMLLYGGAVGHVPMPDAQGQPVMTAISPSMAPKVQMAAGSYPAMSMANLVEFTRWHLHEAPDSLKAMRESQVSVSGDRNVTDWGLGWFLRNNHEQLEFFGHDGGVVGAGAFLRVVPDKDLIVAGAVNGGNMMGFFDDMIAPILSELGNIDLAPDPTEADVISVQASELEPLAGTYQNIAMGTEVTVDTDNACLLLKFNGRVSDMPPMPEFETPLKPLGEGKFLGMMPGSPKPSVMQFDGFNDNNQPKFLTFGFRSLVRV